jgi:glycosyltransferase involved in cell wall biosynthesis
VYGFVVNSSMKKIVLVYAHDATFVHRDIKMLSNHYEVVGVYTKETSQKKIKQEIKKADIVISWFASKHTLRPFWYANRFNKPKIVIVGGFDASDMKGYGLLYSFFGKLLARYLYYSADAILPVNDSLGDTLCFYFPKVKNKNQIVHTGFDSCFWNVNGEKRNLVLTVAIANDMYRLKFKGLDTFVESAKFFPDQVFLIVGVDGEAEKYLQRKIPKNVKIINFLEEKDLVTYYQEAKVFCLLSRREGLPTVMCEAMLCECIPVGTKVSGITTAMGDIGFYAEYSDLESTVQAIKKALNSSEDIGKKARQRIIDLFNRKKREKGLIKIIEGLVKK